MQQLSPKLLFSFSVLLLTNLCNAQSVWPKSITATDGSVIEIYQPQPESFEGNILKCRAAISIAGPGGQEPVFGVVWSTDQVSTDRDKREVAIESVKVDNIKIPADTLRQERSFIATTLETYVPRVVGSIPLDELLAQLDEDQVKGQLSGDLSTRLPKLYFRTQRSMMVVIDGEPRLKKNDRWGLQVVQNSPFTIVQGKDSKFYLYGGGHWYDATNATGPYTFTGDKVPREMKKVARELKKAAKKADDMPTGESEESDSTYDIVVSTVPAELIQSDGAPDLAPIDSTSLLYVKNSDNDIFVDTHTQQYYVLLEGRWYTAPALNENSQWKYVQSDQLPADFARIPEGSPKDNVLASVAGTQPAREAVMDAHIPQTAKIDRHTTTTQVEYDGPPQFKPIEGTHLQYAINTAMTVILFNGKYYVVDNGVWFIGDTPTGPWVVSTTRPEEMDLIPPSCPVYGAKYVYIYDVMPDYVYMGYTPGYLNSFVYGPTVVYGTGYYYDPWFGAWYVPRPWTWGFGMVYNPWTGWGFYEGLDWDWFNYDLYFGFGYGFGFGFGWGPWWGLATFYWPAYRNWHGGRFRGYSRGGYYGRRATIDPATHMHMRYDNNAYRGRAGVSTGGFAGGGGVRGGGDVRGGGGNLFADRDGNVYRRNEQGQWEQRVNRAWSPMGGRADLQRQQDMRSRGQVRTGNFQRASNFGGMRFGGGGAAHFGGGGGGHFGGGGRR
jgi:hypothetical protein